MDKGSSEESVRCLLHCMNHNHTDLELKQNKYSIGHTIVQEEATNLLLKQVILKMPGIKLIESVNGTRIEWEMLQFQSMTEYLYRSPSFQLFNSRWFLWVYTRLPMTFPNQSMAFVCMRLEKEADNEYHIEYTMGLQYPDHSSVNCGIQKFAFMKDIDLTSIHMLSSRGCLRLAEEDSLTVFCNIRLMTEPALKVSSPSVYPSGIEALPGYLKYLYQERCFKDVTIKVNDMDFFAHKAVLSARSSLFSTMFEHNVSDENCGIVKITDCDPETFEEFLTFLYTGNVSTNNSVNLYYIANKFDIKDLKEGCVDVMKIDLVPESFCDIFHLAALHKEDNLLIAATEFFIDNVTAILSTANWQKFLAENSSLGNELFMKFANKVKNQFAMCRKGISLKKGDLTNYPEAKRISNS